MASVEAARGAAAAEEKSARAGPRRAAVDGRVVDQAVAYVLMAAALAVTYLVH